MAVIEVRKFSGRSVLEFLAKNIKPLKYGLNDIRSVTIDPHGLTVEWVPSDGHVQTDRYDGTWDVDA